MGLSGLDQTAAYAEDWQVAEGREEAELREELWQQFRAHGPDGVDIDLVRDYKLPEEEVSSVYPLMIASNLPISDMGDAEFLYLASPAELVGLRAALGGRVPLFVAAATADESRVDVRLGWIEHIDDDAGVALLVLSDERPARREWPEATDLEVSVTRPERFARRRVRSGQARFKIRVLAMYGPRCAVCSVDHVAVLEAAHIRPWIERGSNHPGNGLVLCPLHHRAFDFGLWAIEPISLDVIGAPGGPSLEDLLISRPRLETRPLDAALDYAWARRWRAGRREGDIAGTGF